VSKESLDDLAIFGGSPAFAAALHVGRPNLGDRDRLRARLDDILDRRWLTNQGPYVQEFERRLAELAQVKHCIAMCNATVALEIAIRALGLRGEVIVPSYTFVATAHALQWQEITPVFCDVDPRTHNIDPGAVEAMITPRTTGIIGVHLWGRACDVQGLEDIARRRGLQLMFDAAHAFGCTYRGRPLGGSGRAEVFSFHATKFLNSFEGGAVATNDDALAAQIRLMSNFGFAGYDRVVYVGTNGKMTEISAAMGLTNLEGMDDFLHENRRAWHDYADDLRGLPGLTMMEYDPQERSNFQYVVIEIDSRRAGLTRDDLLAVLHAENVLARRYFFPGCHRMEPYRSYFPHAGLTLPRTEALCDRVLVLPTGPTVSTEDIRAITAIIGLSLRNASHLLPRLQPRRPALS
jgi:dTDP-4-amino-4,6-dideoxygalactose transaminase